MDKYILYRLKDKIETFYYNFKNFFKSIWKFRKELYYFRSYDYHFNLMFLKRSLELTVNYLEKFGYEEDISRNKKIDKIKRIVEILDIELEDRYLELAEKELGIKMSNHTFESIPIEGTDTFELKIDLTEDDKKLFDKSTEIEKQLWEEFFVILKGQNYPLEDWDKDFDGSGLKGWWD